MGIGAAGLAGPTAGLPPEFEASVSGAPGRGAAGAAVGGGRDLVERGA